MSGHSKWANIKHKKAKADAQRGQTFSKLTKEIVMAARRGGGNLEFNLRLKTAVQRAREANIPMDTITRAIKKGTGELEGVNYEELTYEGYGPGGVAMMVDVVTDNRNRAASEIRYIFSKHGGNMAEAGAVAWMFDKMGYICIDREDYPQLGEDEVLALALEAGANDVKTSDENFELFCGQDEVESIRTFLMSKGIKPSVAEVTMVPKTTVKLDESQAEKMLRLMDALEAHDDVQKVYANFDIPEEILERLAVE
ncbi:MAG TPA: YebC/PmpR family DNA-binding transcriptional regulator [Firmicutes bacterium]|nr:YebC/PmpR family DNA-binding transcriptional regulator [Bacillota bacterium]